MESNHEDTSSMNFSTFICWICSGLFYGLQQVTAEDLYTFIFRLLSLISVAMVIIINWPKVKAVLQTKVKRKKKDENRS